MEREAMTETYDVAIAGGGIAGCAAAIRILQRAPEAKVLVLERGRYPRQKVCGEFLSPEGVETLRSLGGEPLHRVLASAIRIPRARLHAYGRSAGFPVEPTALGISRLDLDLALWQQATSLGADCRAECSVKSIEGTGPFRLQTNAGEFSARAAINTAGRWSALSASRSRPNGHPWIGLKAHFRERLPERAVELYFFRNGYCGLQPVADDTIDVCALVRADAATRLDQVFALNPALHERSRSWQPLMEPLATAPVIFRRPEPVTDHIFNAGDAAGFIDPFSGNGMSLALQSGVLTAACVREFLSGRVDLATALAGYAAAYREHLGGGFRRVAWLRALVSMPRAAALATVQMLNLPAVGSFVVRKTRVLGSVASSHPIGSLAEFPGA
jgi:flavin-dependent dehydrogenase